MGGNKKSLIQIINETPLGRRIAKFTAAGFLFSGILLGADSYIAKRKSKNIDNIVYAAEMHAATPKESETMKNRIMPEAEKKFFEAQKTYVKECISSNPTKAIIKSTVDPIGETFDIIKQEYCQSYPEEYAALKGKLGFLETATKIYSSTNIPLTALKESIRYGKNMVKELMQKKADDLKLKALDKELDFVSQRIDSIEAGISQPNICRVILPFKTPETLDEVIAYRKLGVVDYMKAIRAKQGVLVVDSISKLTEQVNPEEWLSLYERSKAQSNLSPYFPPEDLNPCRMLQEGYEGTKVAVMKRFYQMDEYGRLIPIGDTLDEIVKKEEAKKPEIAKPQETYQPKIEQTIDECDYFPIRVGMQWSCRGNGSYGNGNIRISITGKEYFKGREWFTVDYNGDKVMHYKDQNVVKLYENGSESLLLELPLYLGKTWSETKIFMGKELRSTGEVISKGTVYFDGKPYDSFKVKRIITLGDISSTEYVNYGCNIGIIDGKREGKTCAGWIKLINIR